jgi:hypothetical protein
MKPLVQNHSTTKKKRCKITIKNGLIPVETIPRMREGMKKENDGGCEFNYDIFDILQELL